GLHRRGHILELRLQLLELLIDRGGIHAGIIAPRRRCCDWERSRYAIAVMYAPRFGHGKRRTIDRRYNRLRTDARR
ncbi:MAG: hypothetical protein ACRDNM_05160, partial [Gaiellaceae bacterium]